jgi:hypothetical protein
MVDNEVRLSGLEKFAKYSVTVQAFNSRGDGPTSDAVIIQTLEDGEKNVLFIVIYTKTISDIRFEVISLYD